MDLENKTITVSKKAARRFLLHKQFLLPERKRSGPSGVKTVLETLRAVQYDPLNPCGRNTDLVLQSRVKHIHPDAYFDWLYVKRRGAEYYDKELCIVPVEDLPWCRLAHWEGDGSAIGTFLKMHKQELNRLLRRIRSQGPVSSLDLMDSRKADIWWGPMHWGKNAVDSLWRAGKLAIAYRTNGRKYYDVPENVYGRAVRIPRKQSEATFLQSIERRLRATGMLPASGAGTGWLGLKTGTRLGTGIRKLVGNGTLCEVHVQGCSKPFVIRNKDRRLLASMEHKRIGNAAMAFLAPLDNLLWDRAMIEQLFGFAYRWEVYTPRHKRTHGYYVLPILCQDMFVGRIEPVLKDTTLLIKGFWKEPGAQWNPGTRKKFRDALAQFQRYARAERIVWKCAQP